MARPYFSVIICNYNYGRFLRQAIDSLLAQDFPETEREVIVVDDGSTDESVAVAGSFKDKIRLIRQKNQKQAGAFKTGYGEARGEVFCLFDSDDYCRPGKLSAFAERLADPSVGSAQHYLREVDADGRPLGNTLPSWPRFYTIEDFAAGRCEDAATSGLAFRRSIVEKVPPVPSDLFCWYDKFMIAHGLLHAKMANIPEVLGYYRIHGRNNWARRFSSPDKLDGYVTQGRLFFDSIEARLKETGRALSPGFRDAIDTDFARSALLAAVSRGRRGRALSLWKTVPGGDRHARFYKAMLLSALIHPDIYMLLYRLYSENVALRKARRLLRFFLPSPIAKG